MITGFYGGLLALIYFKLSIETISARRKHQISVGYGPKNEIASIVSAHNNFASYVIFLLLLLYLCEASGQIPNIVLHLVGLSFATGRFLHFVAFRNQRMNFKLRRIAMHLTLWPLLLLGLLNVYASLRGLLV